MRGQPAVRIALTLALGVAFTTLSVSAEAARGRATRPRAPAVQPSSAESTLAWGRRYLDREGWTLQANSAQAIVFVRAMRPARPNAFWVRFERRYPATIGSFTYRSILQRTSVNCSTGEFRTEETYYFRDNNRGGPSRHERGDGAGWETPLPDSLMESAVQWQCRAAEPIGPARPPVAAQRDERGPARDVRGDERDARGADRSARPPAPDDSGDWDAPDQQPDDVQDAPPPNPAVGKR
jgi:hypothetical protein